MFTVNNIICHKDPQKNFEILLKSELPVTSLSDFLLLLYILKG